MKGFRSIATVLVSACTLTTAAQAALTASQMVGTYQITVPFQNVQLLNEVTLRPDGVVELIETSPIGKINCEGTYRVRTREEIVWSDMTCANGRSFSQTVSTRGLTLDDLYQGTTTQVSSTLFPGGINEPVVAHIKKLR